MIVKFYGEPIARTLSVRTNMCAVYMDVPVIYSYRVHRPHPLAFRPSTTGQQHPRPAAQVQAHPPHAISPGWAWRPPEEQDQARTR